MCVCLSVPAALAPVLESPQEWFPPVAGLFWVCSGPGPPPPAPAGPTAPRSPSSNLHQAGLQLTPCFGGNRVLLGLATPCPFPKEAIFCMLPRPEPRAPPASHYSPYQGPLAASGTSWLLGSLLILLPCPAPHTLLQAPDFQQQSPGHVPGPPLRPPGWSFLCSHCPCSLPWPHCA